MDYKKEYKQQIKRNISNVLKELELSTMAFKIASWADKFGYDFDLIKNKIKEDEIFRCVFAKDPAKQNLYQNLAAKYISELPEVKKFQILPSGGDNAVYLIRGKILSGKLLGVQSRETKSIDFAWKTGVYTFLASHKYTELSGGAQDNQYSDIKNFLENARDCNQKNTIFLAICDGDYYCKRDSQTGDETKIARLTRLTDGKTSFVLNICMLREFLKKYL